MGSVVAECPEHGIVSIPGLMTGDGVAIMVGSTIDCPRCGRPIPILDGSYRSRDRSGRSTVFRPTPAAALRLRTIMDWASEQLEQSVSEQQIAESLAAGIEREVPALARLIRGFRGANGMALAAWISVLLMVYQILIAGTGLTADDVQRIVDSNERESTHTPAPTEHPDESSDTTPDE